MSRSPAVLCIDDNVLGLAVRKAMLESRDYKVFTAENGPAGLEIVKRELVDLVVLDYEMPDMDGGRVAQQLRRQHADIPILLLTGFPGRIPESLLATVDGFVVKGSSPHVFLQEVERITSGSAIASPQSAPAQKGRRKRPREQRELAVAPKRLLRRCRQKRKR